MSGETLQKRLAEVESRIAAADALQRVHLVQERRNIEQRLARSSRKGGDDMKALEAGFIEVAAEYGRRKGIGYATWREIGVSADVLQKAGIHWSRRG
ncbi:MAG: hypothetical protein ACRDZ6_05240 [Acidimicrobiales bacterium]